MNEKERIRTFVRNTLGCGCPEEVFEHIECRTDTLVEDVRIRTRLNIGNRLLIYVLEADGLKSLASIIPRLLWIGKKERDSLGFNRFRLVVAAEESATAQEARELFRRADPDEKMHLHIVQRKDLPC